MSTGIDGCWLVLPFQCETCWMINLEGKPPEPSQDLYVKAIRQANLDAMHGYSPLTVSAHVREMKSIIRNAKTVGRTPNFQPRGPMPTNDTCGMGPAVDELLKSRIARGRINEWPSHGAIRRVRALYTKNWQSSPEGITENFSFGHGTGQIMPTKSPTQSLWFNSYNSGHKTRLGGDSQANHAVSIKAMVKVLDLIEEDAAAAAEQSSLEESRQLIKVGAYLAVCTVGSLRGHEGFYTDLAGLRKHITYGQEGSIPANWDLRRILSADECARLPHVVLTLLGKFKGEKGTDHHKIGLASTTMSGIKSRWWIEQLIEVNEAEGKVSGPAFSTPGSTPKLAMSWTYDLEFKRYLKLVQTQYEDERLIPPEAKVDELYGTFRTPRKTAETRAKQAGIGKQDVDAMNRWSKVDKAKGRQPKLTMNEHYTDCLLMMPITWRYSYAL